MRSDRIMVILLLALILVEKEALAWLLIPHDAGIRDLGFGFGHYISALLDGRGYVNCPGESGHCEHVSRMPVLPLLMALLAGLGERQVEIALLKNLLLSLLVWCGLRPLLTPARAPRFGRWLVAVLAVFALSPPLLKHAAHITYEEGLLVELLLLWMVWLIVRLDLFAPAPQQRLPAARADAWLLGLATLIFLTKSSMILLWLGSLALALATARRRGGRALIAPLLALLPVLAWGAHAWHHTGQFSLMSSFDGSNFYRSWNSTALRIYPEVSLDRVVDTPVITLAEGVVVANDAFAAQPRVVSEQDWKQAYLAAGRDWIAAHPGPAATLLLTKAANFFLSLARSPGPQRLPQDAEGWVVSAWLLAGRVMQLLLLVALLRAPVPATTRLLLAVALLAYAAPYVAGFNYERHITPFLYLVFVAGLALRLSPAARPATAPGHPCASP